MTTSLIPVPPRLATAPGDPAHLVVRITNLGADDAWYAVRLIGLDTAWWNGAQEVMVAAGDTADVPIQVTLPLGFPAGTQLLGIEAAPAAPPNGHRRRSQPARTTVELEVAPRREVYCDLEPDSITGGRKGRFQVVVGNRSAEPTRIELRGQGPEGHLRFRFDTRHPELAPGQRLVVPARVRGRRPKFGHRARRPFTVTAHGPGEPARSAGAFTQTPWISAGFLKVIAIFTLLAMWAGLLWVGLNRLDRDERETRTAQDAAAVDDDGDASGGGAGGGGGGAGGGGAGGGGADGAGGADEGPVPFELTGAVTSVDPGGVAVSLRPISVGDGQGSSAQLGLVSTGGRRTKVLGPFPRLPSQQTEPRSTVTDASGEYGFNGVQAPGFYEIRFAKAGYATVSHIVEAPADGSPVKLDVELVAGDGAIGGIVTNGAKPLGGVDVTVSDGEVAYTTKTPTSGAEIGRWSLDGLTTPATWLVTFERRGFSTETALVALPAGGSETGLRVAMRAGVGSVSGAVVGPGPVGIEPKGGLTVTATDGTITRTTSTLTEGVVGSYLLPQLPVPGIYTVTVDGPGWLARTSSVELTPESPNASGVDFALVKTTGAVSGRVKGVDENGDPLVDANGDELEGLNSVGVTATDGEATFKTTSAEDGVFSLDGLSPGSYVVTFVKAGFRGADASVTVAAGDDVLIVDDGVIVLTRIPPVPVPPTGVVTGVITSSLNESESLGGVDVVIQDARCDDPDTEMREDDPNLNGDTADGMLCTATSNDLGSYQIEGAPTGAFTVCFGTQDGDTDRCVDGNQFVGASKTVQIPATTPVTLNASLLPFGSVFGTIVSDIDRDGNAEGLAGVAITVTHRATQRQLGNFITESNGAFDTGRLFGPQPPVLRVYDFTFSRAGVLDLAVPLTIKVGDRQNVNRTMVRAPEIRGEVRDGHPAANPDGLGPLADATVTVTGDTITRTATSDANGEYRFYLCGTDGSAFGDGDDVPLIEYEDQDGVPVPTPIDPVPLGQLDGSHIPDPDLVDNCLAADTYSVRAAKTGYTDEVVSVSVFGDQVKTVNAALYKAPVDTTGFVYWSDGGTRRPIGNASVFVTGVTDVNFNPGSLQFSLSTQNYFAVTDATTGEFRIPATGSLDPTPLFFLGAASVSHSQFFSGQSENPLTPGDCNAPEPPVCNEIELAPQPGNIVGRVTINPNLGQSLADLTVTVMDPDGIVCCQNQTLIVPNAGGAFVQVAGVAAGTYELRLEWRDFEPVTVSVLVTPGFTVDFGSAELRATSALTVDVIDNSTAGPLEGATVTVDTDSTTTAVDDGSATLGELHPFDAGYVFTLLDDADDGVSGATITLHPGGLTGKTDEDGVFDAPDDGIVARSFYTATVTDSDGDPISGAQLIADPQPAEDVTDPNGDAAFDVFGAVTYTVTASKAPHYVTAEPQHVAPPPGIPVAVSIALDRLNRISGTVSDGTEPPLTGTTVTLTEPGGSERSIPAQADGSYEFDDLGAGTYTVLAEKDGYAGAGAEAEIVFSGLNEVATQDLLLEPYRIHGTLTDQDGASLDVVTVALDGPGTDHDEKVTVDGSYSFDGLEDGDYTVTATKDGYADASVSVTLNEASPDRTEDLQLMLFRIRGTLTDHTGAALDVVTVALDGPGTDHDEKVTVDGNYTFDELEAGDYTVTATKPGYETAKATVKLTEAAPDATEDLQLMLFRIRGTLTDQDGAALAGVDVTIDGPDPDDEETVTAAGSYEFDGLQAGVYTVTAAKAGYADASVEVTLSVANSDLEENLQLHLYRIGGTLTDQDELPLAGVEVTIDGPGTDHDQSVTVDGSYTFDGLEAGDYTVTATKDGYGDVSMDVTLSAENPDVPQDLILRRLVTVTIQVRDDGAADDQDPHAAVPDATVTLPDLDPQTTPASGDVAFDDLLAGVQYQVNVSAAGFFDPVTTITVDGAQATQTVTVILDRRNVISGTVMTSNTPTPEPVAGAEVTVEQDGDVVDTATTNASGVYQIPDLGIGTFEVSVTLPAGYSNPSASVTVEFGENTEQVGTANFTAVEQGGGGMGGTVTGAGAEFIEGVTVLATSLTGDQATAVTGADGSWSLAGLEPTVWDITYSRDGYSPLTITEPVAGESVTTTDVALSAKGNAVSGTVTGRNPNDAIGSPLDGVSVSLLDASGAVVAQQPATAGGGYSFTHLGDGTYTLVFERAGYETARTSVTLAHRDRAVIDAALVAGNGTLTVRVRSGDGSPVAGAAVRLSSPTQAAGGRTAVTGADGGAVFEELPPATDYQVDVDGHPAGFGQASIGPVAVGPGETDAAVDVTLAAPGSIEGTVSADGTPLDGVGIALYIEGQADPLASTYSGGDGTAGGYLFDRLDPTLTYRLVFAIDGYETVERRDIGVPEAGITTANVSLRRLDSATMLPPPATVPSTTAPTTTTSQPTQTTGG